MLNIKYKINLQSIDIQNHHTMPSVYGVFVIESDIGISLRDKSFLDDDLFDVFKFNDDVFLWFFNILMMNIELLKETQCQYVLNYDLDNLPPYNAILFHRIGDMLNTSDITHHTKNPAWIFDKNIPSNYETIKTHHALPLSIWLNQSTKKARSFIDEISSLKPELNQNDYVKAFKQALMIKME